MKLIIVDELIKKFFLFDLKKEYVELVVDLNDIYESSNKFDCLIREFFCFLLN